MSTTSITWDKQNFIEYLLFHYEFKSRISVWILNYIKADLETLERMHFVDTIVPSHQTLELSVNHAYQIGVKLTRDGETYYNNNMIFKLIATTHEPFDLKIHFEKGKRNDRYDTLLFNQLLASPSYEAYLQDLYDIHLSQPDQEHLIHELKASIDLSLQLKQEDRFKQYSHILNSIQFRNFK
ncbi:YpiB family protein [Staphylococcus massiliensis]|uniref:YpiB family protein n=1 Tax=Staphylococcus massiliensis TaxID=555791 RepID=UPI001EE13502|nr:YpiB family protein [Staphylococcus massiliensis]MCG3401101.1 YpiB family protein [Staphylococcus massiliensis]